MTKNVQVTECRSWRLYRSLLGICLSVKHCYIYIYYLRHFPSEQVFVFVFRFSDIVFATDSVPAVLGTTQDNKYHNNFFESPQSAAVQRLSLQTFKLQKQDFLFRCFLESLDALEQ